MAATTQPSRNDTSSGSGRKGVSVSIRPATKKDAQQLLQLHKDVIQHDPSGLLRQPWEITEDFIHDVLEKSIPCKMIFVAETEMVEEKGKDRADSDNDDRESATKNYVIVGEIHAHTPPIAALRHLLTDLAIAVHPSTQGQGVGRKLFEHFLENVPPSIARVELYTRENNQRNVEFYKRLGFVSEGPQKHKICMPNRELQTPIHMVWFNPSFDIDTVSILTRL